MSSLSRATLYTVTVMNFTEEVYGSCSRRFSHRSLRLSQPLTITAVFAKRLKAARAMRGLSQRSLGALVDKDGDKNRGAARINRYEQQVNLADMEKAAELAKALNVPLAYLFAETDDLAELILGFSGLSEHDRSQVLADLKKRGSPG